MARVYYGAEALTAGTANTTSTYADQTSITILSADASSSTWAIFFACEHGHATNTTTSSKSRLFNSSSSTVLSEGIFQPTNTGAHPWHPHTGVIPVTFGASPGNQTIKLQYANSSGSSSVQSRNATIFAIKLGANDASGVDLTQTTSTSTTWVTKATFTAPGNGTYDIFLGMGLSNSFNFFGVGFRILLEDNTTVVYNGLTANFFVSTTTDIHSVAATVRRTLTTGQTVKVQFNNPSAAGTITSAYGFAVGFKTADFDNTYNVLDGTNRTTTSGTYVDRNSAGDLTFTPAAAVDHLLFGSIYSAGAVGAVHAAKTLLPGSSVYDEPSVRAAVNGDIISLALRYYTSMPASSSTQKWQIQSDGSNTLNSSTATMGAWQLAAGSVDTPVSPSTLALTVTTFAPTVGVARVLTPATLALAVTTFAPTVATIVNGTTPSPVTIEIAFADGPFVTSPTWTAVSTDVRAWSVIRGRSSELDSYQTGTASVTLDNRDRLYDPNYAAGTYYGRLLPRRQIRISASWEGISYNIFRGFIQSWPQQYDYDGMDTTVTLSCYDAFGILAALPLNDSYYDLYVASKTPIARWPLGSVGTVFPEVAGKLIGYLDGDLQALSSEGATVADPPSPYMGPSTNFNGRSRLGVSAAPWDTLAPLREYTITGWFRTTALSPGAPALRPIYSDGYYGAQQGVRVGIDVNGRLHYVGFDTSVGVFPEAYSNINVVDGGWHHFAVRQANAGTVTIYIDGVDATVPVLSAQSDLMASGAVIRLGMKTGINPDSVFVGDIAEVAIFDYALTATDVANLYMAGVAPLEGDTTGDQLAAVLDAVGWSATLRDLTADGAECCPVAWSGESALSYAQKLDTTEQGAFFIAANGYVTFRNRYYTLQDTHGSVVQATFSDDGSDNRYNDLATDYGGPGTIINDVIVSTPGGGATQRYTDSTSVDANGPSAISLDSLSVSANAALNLATFKVNRYKDPLTRATPFTLKPSRNPHAMWAAVLGLELGYRIKVEKTPQLGGGKAGVGPQIVQELLTEQIAHEWTANAPAAWTVTIGGSPGFISDGFWQLGISGLGVDTTLGY